MPVPCLLLPSSMYQSVDVSSAHMAGWHPDGLRRTGRKRLWPVLKYFPRICVEGLRKTESKSQGYLSLGVWQTWGLPKERAGMPTSSPRFCVSCGGYRFPLHGLPTIIHLMVLRLRMPWAPYTVRGSVAVLRHRSNLILNRVFTLNFIQV